MSMSGSADSDRASRASILLSSQPTRSAIKALASVDQACGIQQRCCLVQKLLHVECDFEALLVKSRTGASVGCACYSRGFIESAANFGQIGLDCCFD